MDEVKEPSKLDEQRAAAEAANQDAAHNERADKKEKALVANAEKKASLLAAAAENVGIQNTLEVVEFGVALVKAIDGAKADGKIDLADIGQLFPVAPLVVPMIDGVGQIPKELGDLSDEELELLLAEVSKIVGGSEQSAKLIVKVKAAIKFAHAGYDLYVAFKK